MYTCIIGLFWVPSCYTIRIFHVYRDVITISSGLIKSIVMVTHYIMDIKGLCVCSYVYVYVHGHIKKSMHISSRVVGYIVSPSRCEQIMIKCTYLGFESCSIPTRVRCKTAPSESFYDAPTAVEAGKGCGIHRSSIIVRSPSLHGVYGSDIRAVTRTDKESARRDKRPSPGYCVAICFYCLAVVLMFLLCGARAYVSIVCMGLGHMFLLCGARPYVSIVWRSAICFYCVALGHMFLLRVCVCVCDHMFS